MNRGSNQRLCAASEPVPGFNEAPIHESGKYLNPLNSSYISLCFNEAPIHESGKWHPDAREAALRGASMRPRFMNRGSGIRMRERLRFAGLQ